MRLLTAKEIKNSWKLFDENNNLIGERMFVGFLGTHTQLKLNGRIYKIRNFGFFMNEIHYEDEIGKLLVKIDFVHQRVFYYSETVTDIYYFKSKFWSKKMSLHKFENDDLVMNFNFKRSFSKYTFEIQTNQNFENSLLTMAFLDLNLRNFEG